MTDMATVYSHRRSGRHVPEHLALILDGGLVLRTPANA